MVIGAIAAPPRSHHALDSGVASSTVTTHELWLIGAKLIAVALFAKISEDVVEHETTIFDSTVTDFVVWILRRRDHAALWSFLFLAAAIQIVDAALKLGFHHTRPVSISRYTFLYAVYLYARLAGCERTDRRLLSRPKTRVVRLGGSVRHQPYRSEMPFQN
jgi:hypothetical protein